MNELLFYAKPGCVGNQRQQALLRGLGHSLRVLDLISESWTVPRLREFFAGRPPVEWFNPSAPQIKFGVLDIEALDEQQALRLMVRQPLLIRRPLMQYGRLRQAGFEDGPVLAALGLVPDARQDFQSCPVVAAAAPCGEPL